jgi:hypothetical protein
MVKRGIKEVTVVPPVKKVSKASNTLSTATSGLPVEETTTSIPDIEGPVIAQDAKSANIVQALKDLKEPYDPAKPNDYQEYCKERTSKQIEKERQTELQLQQKDRQDIKQQNKSAGGTINGVPTISPVAERLMLKMGWKGRGHGMTSFGLCMVVVSPRVSGVW